MYPHVHRFLMQKLFGGEFSVLLTVALFFNSEFRQNWICMPLTDREKVAFTWCLFDKVDLFILQGCLLNPLTSCYRFCYEGFNPNPRCLLGTDYHKSIVFQLETIYKTCPASDLLAVNIFSRCSQSLLTNSGSTPVRTWKFACGTLSR